MVVDKINISILSKYRSALMGMAMLMVMWHHLPMSSYFMVFDYLKINAGFGVDVFLLLSGFGLYYSCSRDFNIYRYYVRRFVRIIPLYALVILIVSCINGDLNLVRFLYTISTLGWWCHYGIFDWFIPNLILMYILYPLFFLITKQRLGLIIGAVIVLFDFFIVASLNEYSNFQQWYRYPVFFLGSLVAQIQDDKNIKNIQYIFFIISIFAFIFSVSAYLEFCPYNQDPSVLPDLKKNGFLFMPYLFMVFPFCLIFAWLMDYTHIYFVRFLSFTGSMSLELYLVHGQVISYIRQLLHSDFMYNKILLTFVAFVFMFIICYILHYFNKIISNYLLKVLNA